MFCHWKCGFHWNCFLCRDFACWLAAISFDHREVNFGSCKRRFSRTRTMASKWNIIFALVVERVVARVSPYQSVNSIFGLLLQTMQLVAYNVEWVGTTKLVTKHWEKRRRRQTNGLMDCMNSLDHKNSSRSSKSRLLVLLTNWQQVYSTERSETIGGDDRQLTVEQTNESRGGHGFNGIMVIVTQ